MFYVKKEKSLEQNTYSQLILVVNYIYMWRLFISIFQPNDILINNMFDFFQLLVNKLVKLSPCQQTCQVIIFS